MKNTIFFFFILWLCLFATGCDKQKVNNEISPETLFSLEYGAFYDDINLFALGRQEEVNTFCTMKDGMFFIANGGAKKIMVLNSYGKMTKLLYNPDFLFEPSFSQDETQQANSTQIAKTYPFNTLGPIAVDTKNNIYVADTLPKERIMFDSTNRQQLKQVVLHFSSDGNLVNYIGQEGPGGTPFPFIHSIWCNGAGELIVICITVESQMVYWFSKDGYLMYQLPISTQTLPATEEKATYTIDKIIPDATKRVLYIKADTFTPYIDKDSGVQSGITYKDSHIFCLLIEAGKYTETIMVPSLQDATQDKLQNTQEPYEFLGVTDSSWFFFIAPNEKGFSCQVIGHDGKTLMKRQLELNIFDVLFHNICLSREGIVCMLVADNKNARFLWWRLDEVIKDRYKRNGD